MIDAGPLSPLRAPHVENPNQQVLPSGLKTIFLHNKVKKSD